MKNRKCIYTALTGGYDNLNQPQVIDDSYDYICFSNDIKQSNIGVWQIRPIPFTHKDSKRVAMYAKFHPHILLKEYDYSVWIDANKLIKDSFIYSRADQLYSINEKVAHILHPYRDCIYKEAFDCMLYGTDKVVPLMRTINFLLKHGYPFRHGLYENNLIYWNHHSDVVIKALDIFWPIYSAGSRRDQLSLNYAYYISDLHPVLFLPKGEHMGDSMHIERVNHTSKDKRHKYTKFNFHMNSMKIRIVRLLFLMKGYDLRYRQLYS